MTLQKLRHLSINEKILYVFLFASFIPIIGLVYLSNTYISSVLEKDTNSNLRKHAKSYGLFTYEKIVSYKDALDKISSLSDNYLPENLISNFEHIELIKIVDIDSAGFGRSTKPRFNYYYKADNSIYFSLEKLHLSSSDEKYVLRGTFSLDSLFNDASNTPFNEPICIFTELGNILFCNEDIILKDAAIKNATEIINSNDRVLEFNYMGTHYILSSWELFLPSHFQAETWKFVIVKKESVALSAVRKFENFIIPIALALLLIVAYLIYRFIEKLFSPLAVLTKATNKIASGDYDVDLKIDTHDEFQKLSASFNVMSSILGFQHFKDKVFSDLEQLTLSTLDIHHSIEKNISNLCCLFDAKWLVVSVVNPIKSELIKSHCLNLIDSKKDSLKSEYFHIEHGAFTFADEGKTLQSINKNEFRSSFQPIASGFHSDLIWVYTLSISDEVGAYILFSLENNHSLDNQTTTALIEFSERFATIYMTHKQREILYLRANYDALTRLPNRARTLELLDEMWAKAQLSEEDIAIFYIDLDNFKNVNDLSGHHAGNLVLSEVADRLKVCAGSDAVISRLSGDEFCILLSDVVSDVDVTSLAEKIIEQFAMPFDYKEVSFFLGASIGIVIGPGEHENPNAFIDKADLAMFKAKQDGKNRFVLFDSDIERERNYRLSLEQFLHYALSSKEITINYQPKIDLATGDLKSVECLARWHQKELGFVPTDKFILLAEESGMIHEIGEWILKKSCHQYVDWVSKGIRLESIAVNVSAKQIASNRFSEIAASAIKESGIEPSCLELEITESAFINDSTLLVRELKKLHQLGVKISIDDFGKEYSSLSYLKKIPFDTLKIDREFIIDLETDLRDQHIVDVVINIGHTLGKKIVAEGIETTKQRDILLGLGCDIGQGYLFSRPLSDIQFLEFAHEYNKHRIDKLSQMNA